MSDRMVGPRAKIKRAKKHVHELGVALDRFIETEPYDLIAKDDGIDLRQYAVIRSDPPLELSLIAGDAFHNMRSALDLLFCQLLEANNIAVKSGDTFPIHDTREKYETGGRGQVKARVAGDAFKIIDNLKPYKGGNDALWALHKLDIVDKHRTILTAPGSFQELILRINMPSGAWATAPLKPADRMCPLKDGDEVFRCRSEDFEHYKGTKVFIQVAIHEPGIVECEPLSPFISDLGDTIEKIVELFATILSK